MYLSALDSIDQKLQKSGLFVGQTQIVFFKRKNALQLKKQIKKPAHYCAGFYFFKNEILEFQSNSYPKGV